MAAAGQVPLLLAGTVTFSAERNSGPGRPGFSAGVDSHPGRSWSFSMSATMISRCRAIRVLLSGVTARFSLGQSM